jgi:O-acetyl-ADP-ribose deacetylase (regulator of RNase III)
MASQLNEVQLNKPWRNVRPTKLCRLLHGGVLFVSMGSVVEFSGDAIVNAANVTCLGGGGVDGAISEAGGPVLLKARKALPIVRRSKGEDIRCPTGEARITIGGRLRAKWCIHAVGPNYRVEMQHGGVSAAQCDKLLKSAYTGSMHVAAKNGVKTIAFSLISAGIFRGPRSLGEVLDIAVQGVVAGDYAGLEEVRACARGCLDIP